MIKRVLSFMLMLVMSSSMSIGAAAAEAGTQVNSPDLGNAQYSLTEAQGYAEEEQDFKRVIDPDKPMIALTFDDGPSKYTPEVLKVLKENDSKATFFVVGSQVERFGDVLNQVIEDGNEVGNHSYNHKDLTTVSDEELYKQVKGTDDLIYIASGYTPTLMRTPYGKGGDELNEKISKPVIKWSVDTRDWESRNTEMIVDEVIKNVKDGDIVLIQPKLQK